MKVYIVIKYKYFEEYLESATEREILYVCQNKELAVKLQKEQILKFVPKEDIEKIKGEIENLSTKELKRIEFDYGNQGIGIEEYNVREK